MNRIKESNIYGIDSDLCGLANTRDELLKNIQISVMDVCNLKFPSLHFDVAYSLNVFEHINDLQKAYDELYRVMKFGGTVFISFSPVWTSYRGHHYYHWIAEYYNLIAPWAHLFMNKEDMYEHILKIKGKETADDAVEYVYGSDYLNRIAVKEHLNLIDKSKFKLINVIKRSNYEFIEEPRLQYKQMVSEKTGYPIEDLDVDGLEIILQKANSQP